MTKIQKHNRNQQRSTDWFCVLPFLVLGIVLWSGQEGQLELTAELQAEQNFYCQMVDEGTWPDYKDTYEESCTVSFTQ
jgi:hypothetical protein